ATRQTAHTTIAATILYCHHMTGDYIAVADMDRHGESVSLFETICQWLTEEKAGLRTLHHEPTFTSEQSARAGGEDVRIGGKALLIKTDEVFRLFVLSAALKLDSAAIRRELAVRQTRFASSDELREKTGLVPGSVPPFGPPILPFEL